MTFKKYSKKEHQIDIKLIDPDALIVLDKLREKGYTAYLVGGSVRDLLLNYTPKDYDISTNALPEEIKKIFSNCFLIGRRFRLAHVRENNKIFEVSTFRKGDNEDASLISNDNEWGTEEEDVLRRDFTVNGLFYDNQSQTIIDYVGGVDDAKKNLLRCIGNPYIRFKQDPVRMIRLLKFRARFGLSPDQNMIDALFSLRSEVLKSSPMRILEEFFRMLESGSSVNFIKNLQVHGFLQILLPELSKYFETPIENDIYTYLREIDRSILSENKKSPRRSILVACIIFPIFHNHIHKLYQSSPKKTHLGKIYDEAYSMTVELFKPTLCITKKILSEVVNIMTTQYRFTPLRKRRQSISRIPKIANLTSSLIFFRMRAHFEPGLTEIYNEWKYYYDKQKKSPDFIDTHKRRRSRK